MTDLTPIPTSELARLREIEREYMQAKRVKDLAECMARAEYPTLELTSHMVVHVTTAATAAIAWFDAQKEVK